MSSNIFRVLTQFGSAQIAAQAIEDSYYDEIHLIRGGPTEEALRLIFLILDALGNSMRYGAISLIMGFWYSDELPSDLRLRGTDISIGLIPQELRCCHISRGELRYSRSSSRR